MIIQKKQFGALVPAKYLPTGVPEGLVEIGLGVLLGYLIGNSKQQPVVGALIGGAAGAVLGMVKLPGTTLKNTYIAPAAPGGSMPNSTPNSGGFDMGAAASIIKDITKNEGLTGLLTSTAAAIQKAWGADTKKPVEAGQKFEQPVSLADENGVSSTQTSTVPVDRDYVVISDIPISFGPAEEPPNSTPPHDDDTTNVDYSDLEAQLNRAW